MRTFVAVSLGVMSGISFFAIAASLVGSLPVAFVVAVIAAGIVIWMLRSPLALPWDTTVVSRGLAVLAVVSTVAALFLLLKLTVFMVDPARPGFSLIPSSTWEVHHSCVSAYFVAARAADRVPNVYADSLYTARDDDPRAQRKALTIGTFNIDVYEYPPPFLLVPRALRNAVPEFPAFRSLWFGVNLAGILIALLVLARMLGPAIGTRLLLLSPLVWLAVPTLTTLQKGNVQGLVIAISVLAMASFEKKRSALGGALLAYATVSKLYPGLLLLYLVVQQKWRAVIWTCAFAIALVVLTIVDQGWPTYTAFLEHLPGLLGGEAFPAFRNPMAMAMNFSVPGLVFKLGLFGVPGMGFAAAKTVGWIYTLIVVVAIVVVARRDVPESARPLVWLGILILATLRSPFLPQSYAAIPPLVLLLLLGARWPATPRVLAAVLLTWAVLNIYWPLDWPMDPTRLALLSGIPQLATIVLAIVALRRVSTSYARP